MRFRAIYGNKVDIAYGTADETLLIETWREELGPFDAADIKVALSACRTAYQDFPPTLFQFSALCRDAMRRRTDTVPRLDYAKRGEMDIDPAVLAQIHTFTQRQPGDKRDPKDWARRVLARHEAGGPDRPPMIAVNGAKEALGL